MLDEMMIQTMKETEQQQNEMDSDLSGTEKVEEVIIKDDSDIKNENDIEKSNDKKSKPSDSETDTDNKKVSSHIKENSSF